MKIQIVGIADRGVPNKERLHLRVLADTNLSYFLVFDTVYTGPNGISRVAKHVFWFPPTAVKAGDQIILYTGSGQPSSQLAVGGVTNHFFYWGEKNTLWNARGACAVLMELTSWQTSRFE